MESPGWFGPYQLLRSLDPARLAPADVKAPRARRWAAVHERDHSDHLVYSLGAARDRFTKKRFLAAAEAISGLRHPHLLTVDAYALSDKLGACIVAQYSGHHGGVVTLDELLEHKGGRMSPAESQRALTHLFEGLGALHEAGTADGALGLDRIHVDPRGSLLIELPGLWRAHHPRQATPQDRRADLLAIARMGHQMLTGAQVPLQGTAQISGELDPRWRAWLTSALTPAEGFETASDALQRLPRPGTTQAPPTTGLVRNLLGKIRSVMPLL